MLSYLYDTQIKLSNVVLSSYYIVVFGLPILTFTQSELSSLARKVDVYPCWVVCHCVHVKVSDWHDLILQ